MSDEVTNGASEPTGDTPAPKPLDYWLCQDISNDGSLTLHQVSAHATSGEAAKAAKRLLGEEGNESTTFYVVSRVYGPIALRARVQRVSVKVDGLEAKRTRPRKAKDTSVPPTTPNPQDEANAPSTPAPAAAGSRRRRSSSDEAPASV
jgi:hypothetical protein